MKHLRVDQVLEIHRRVIEETGGDPAVRDMSLLDSAVSQTRWHYYATVEEKAAALAFSLCKNHPFADDNKRTSYVAMRMFLRRNRRDLRVSIDDAERTFLGLAASSVDREELVRWVTAHASRRS